MDGRASVDQLPVTTRPLIHGLIPTMLAIAAMAVPTAASAAGTTCADANLTPTATNLVAVRNATLCLINAQRTHRGLKALITNTQLRRVAQSYSRTMVSDRFFSHVSPGGSTLSSRVRLGTAYLAGARSFGLGEDIAFGTGNLCTPSKTVRMWMRSTLHRANILNPRYRHVGVGVAFGDPTGPDDGASATYTADFGFRSSR